MFVFLCRQKTCLIGCGVPGTGGEIIGGEACGGRALRDIGDILALPQRLSQGELPYSYSSCNRALLLELRNVCQTATPVGFKPW